MKRNISTLLILLAASLIAANGQGIEHVLRSIEQNNKELQAGGHLTEAKKQETKVSNNLEDPSVTYSYQFGSPQELGKSGEFTVSQGFDFPTVYATRSDLNRLKDRTFDRQYSLMRRDILLRAKELCLDLILLNQEKTLLDERLANADRLTEIYEKRLQTGDANILETNKIKMERMKILAEVAANTSARDAKLQELSAMNGGNALTFTETTYAPVQELTDFSRLKEEVLTGDLALQSLTDESLAARKQISVDKSGWLPKLEVGYRRNTGKGEQFNGFIVGGSLPLFSNKGKVKAARAQSLYADLQKESATEQAEASLLALYNEAQQVKSTLSAYDSKLITESIDLLRRALDARQISTTEYFTELESIYTARQEQMQLENRYQKIMGQIWKNQL